MRVYISSTPEELEPHRMAAVEVVSELGFEPVLRDPLTGGGLDPVAACERQVADADVVVAIVGWRRGSVPLPEAGGDGLRFWTWWEMRGALTHCKPAVVLMAAGVWRPELREDDPKARALVQDFRGELHRLAVFFDEEVAPTRESESSPRLREFRELVRRTLSEVREGVSAWTLTPAAEVRLRSWPPPELPSRPYPLLLPYTHPDLLAGRELELDELYQKLGGQVPILGLHAPSGTGKSSLLAAGLVPRLRAEGWPVAFDRHPAEAGLLGSDSGGARNLAQRLIADLLQGMPDDPAMDTGAFVDALLIARQLANSRSVNREEEPSRAPVLVIDQFEELLADEGARRARATVGMLLAASIQRLPGLSGPLCRWLLAYRREYHGEVLRWLADVLRDARLCDLSGVESLPHDLSRPERFDSWPLPPLGMPRPEGGPDTSARAFLAVIEKPLALTLPDGMPRYPWRFGPGQAERLAEAFAQARRQQPEAPLAPELQVVLARLLARADRPRAGQTSRLELSDEPTELIDRALQRHLRRALEYAFPGGPRPTEARSARIGRTRALLVLRELAGVQRRREGGLPMEWLARAIGPEGREVLEKLATPHTRLVIRQEQAGSPSYALSHDRLAEVLVHWVDDEGGVVGLGIDTELLGLRRFVMLQSQLFESGEVEHATAVPAASWRRIAEHAEALLWTDGQRRWWKACQRHWERQRRRRATRWGSAALVLILVGLGAWSWADRRAKSRARLDQITSGEPAEAFAALFELAADVKATDLLARLSERDKPFEVFDRGVGGVEEARRERAVLRVAELALPLLEASAEARGSQDLVGIASIVWALDFYAGPDGLALRDRVLEPQRRIRPPPPSPKVGDPDWALIPAGTFLMGTAEGGGRDEPDMMDERPRHRVTISALRMLSHEVTNAEYRRFDPDHEGAAALPVGSIDWYQAYAYAAWLGGRLPTEAEWEYAARAGCAKLYCRGDGSAAKLGEVAWWLGNSKDLQTGVISKQGVMRRLPNAWGLFDVYGNVWEWTASWYGPYPDSHEIDPPGPSDNPNRRRVFRGGSAWKSSQWVVAAGRATDSPETRIGELGLRVVLPEPRSGGVHPGARP